MIMTNNLSFLINKYRKKNNKAKIKANKKITNRNP